MTYPRILVVTSCTGEKKFSSDKSLDKDDFKNLPRLQSRTEKLANYICNAGSMYTGMQHLQVMEGVNILRSSLKDLVVDVVILSAGYGLIPENKNIVPYSVTFNEMKASEIDEWAKFLNINQTFQQIISNYDLIFILLGEKYLRTLSLPVTTRKNQTFIFLTSYGGKKYIRKISSHNLVMPLSNTEAKQYGYGLVGLKGFLFKQFALAAATENPKLLEKVYQNSTDFLKTINRKATKIITKDISITNQLRMGLLNPYAKAESPHQLELPLNLPKVEKKKTTQIEKKNIEKVNFDFILNLPNAPNIHHKMQYFIPEWDDLVDPKYNFQTSSMAPHRDPLKDDVYAHQIYSSPNYDGILVSKTIIANSKKKKELIENLGIHKFLSWSQKIMGDCGAFSYLQEDKPPYTTEEILEYYENYGFDYGVSIDHLIVGPFATEGKREFRYDLTLKNAENFIKQHKNRGYSFTPIGAVQGWSPETYRDAVKDLISMGYDYIGLGGLARAKSEEIINILQCIRPHLTPSIRMHLFGVGRIDVTNYFRHLGVTSFDSASPLRKAWLDPQTNYYTPSGKTYIAVRIPSYDNNPRLKRILKAGILDRESLKLLEEKAIDSIRKFDKGKLSLNETLEAILAYDKLLVVPVNNGDKSKNKTRGLRKHEDMYKQLLEDKPWQKCDCAICQKIGVEVIIFRGNNRNRRRGFHNTYIFYQQFQELFEN